MFVLVSWAKLHAAQNPGLWLRKWICLVRPSQALQEILELKTNQNKKFSTHRTTTKYSEILHTLTLSFSLSHPQLIKSGHRWGCEGGVEGVLSHRWYTASGQGTVRRGPDYIYNGPHGVFSSLRLELACLCQQLTMHTRWPRKRIFASFPACLPPSFSTPPSVALPLTGGLRTVCLLLVLDFSCQLQVFFCFSFSMFFSMFVQVFKKKLESQCKTRPHSFGRGRA